MSRSYGKPHTPFHLKYMDEIEELKHDVYYTHDNYNYNWGYGLGVPYRWFETKRDLIEAKWKHSTKKHTCHGASYRFPKSYRKDVNKHRRMIDKQELYKELHYDDYDALYDTWNCKTSDPYGYW